MIPLIILAIILIAIVPVAVVTRSRALVDAHLRSEWERRDDVTFTAGMTQPKGNSSDIKYLGDYDSVEDCEIECDGQDWCKGYTWTDGQDSVYPNQCYGVSNTKDVSLHKGAISGRIISHPTVMSSNDKRESCCGMTLQRVLGMPSAGKK